MLFLSIVYKICSVMTTARQLFQLQCIEQDIESREAELQQKQAQIGESRQLLDAREKLEQGRRQLAGLKQQQQTAEWEADDIGAKLSAAQKNLYSGNIKNPKELSSLQHEVEGLKSKRDGLDEKALQLMEQVETAESAVQQTENELVEVEKQWCEEQKQLAASIEELEGILAKLNADRQQALDGISADALECYNSLKEQKRGQAVAKVEQGTCRGCRISLSTAELQRVKGSNLVMCSSCGRILFID